MLLADQLADLIGVLFQQIFEFNIILARLIAGVSRYAGKAA